MKLTNAPQSSKRTWELMECLEALASELEAAGRSAKRIRQEALSLGKLAIRIERRRVEVRRYD